MNSYSISQLAHSFGLSRSTLLYYDRIGLLCAAERTASNYRRYSRCEYGKLERICLFRRAGLPLADIQKMLSADDEPGVKVLVKRLRELGDEILALRIQQQLITAMLKNMSGRQFTPVMNKQMWVEMLEAAGMDESAMQRWHAEFEVRAPEAHSDFLLSLGIPENEVERIQKWSRDSIAEATTSHQTGNLQR